MIKRDYIIAIAIYLIGFGFVYHYCFYTNYQSVYDAERLMHIINVVFDKGYIAAHAELKDSIYWLQLTSVGMIMPPVWMAHIFNISTSLSVKIFEVAMMPLVPAINYFIFRIKLNKRLAFIATLFVIGQVCFIQAPSYGRFIIAMIPFSLLALMILKNGEITKWKIGGICLLTAAISFTHYGATIVSLTILIATLGCYLLFSIIHHKHYPPVGLVTISFVFLLAFFLIWHFGFNDSVMGAYRGTLYAIESGDAAGIKMIDFSKPDKIIQLAFGNTTPDGDTSITINYGLFAVSWLLVALIGIGMVIKLYRKQFDGVYLMAGVIIAMLIGTVAVPYLSRIYGIERTYFHASTLTPILIANTVKLEYILLPLAIAYIILSYKYGQIVSLTG